VYAAAVERGPRRVLIVDDEPDVARLLAFSLEQAGFEVSTAATCAEVPARLDADRPAVVVLDVTLPDGSGYAVCRALRADARFADVGVLMLTARGEPDDRIEGLEAGADDYVGKPFVVREVVLRVAALAGRLAEARGGGAPAGVADVLRRDRLVVDLAARRVVVDGVEAALRPLEFRLLATLLAQPDRVFSRGELLAAVWGVRGDLNTRTVDVHVRRLRAGLGPLAELIETVHGFGYRARADDGAAPRGDLAR
jgi:two-component system phosphate regulon response regulator PhoB